MKDFYITKILGDSFSISWKNRRLWLLGIFILSLFGSFLPSFFKYFVGQSQAAISYNIYRFFENNSIFLSSFILFAIIFILFLFVASLICQVGMIWQIDNIDSIKQNKFFDAVKNGARFFWKMVCLEIFFGLSYLAVLLIFGIPFVISLAKEYNSIALVFGFLLLLILVFAMLLISLSKHYIFRYLVIKKINVWEAVKSGIFLLKNNFKITCFILLVNFVLSIGFVLLYLLAILFIVAPLLMIGTILEISLHVPFVIAFLILACIAVFVFYFLAKGFMQSVYNSLWSFTFYKLNKK